MLLHYLVCVGVCACVGPDYCVPKGICHGYIIVALPTGCLARPYGGATLTLIPIMDRVV